MMEIGEGRDFDDFTRVTCGPAAQSVHVPYAEPLDLWYTELE